MDTLNISHPDPLAPPAHASITRKSVEYLYATTVLDLRIAHTDAAASNPSLRWCLLEYRVDDNDVHRELSRYFSLSAPKAIVGARRALADAKAVHLTGVGALEIDLDDAEQRWTNACRQKLQALRVKLTELRARTAPDACELPWQRVETGAIDAASGVASAIETQVLAPHYFIYLIAGDIAAIGSAHAATQSVTSGAFERTIETTAASTSHSQLRARNYIGSWLLEENVEVGVCAVARYGWPLPAFQRWIQGHVAMRRKPQRDECTGVPTDCVLAAGGGRCLLMDLPTFAERNLPQGK